MSFHYVITSSLLCASALAMIGCISAACAFG